MSDLVNNYKEAVMTQEQEDAIVNVTDVGSIPTRGNGNFILSYHHPGDEVKCSIDFHDLTRNASRI